MHLLKTSKQNQEMRKFLYNKLQIFNKQLIFRSYYIIFRVDQNLIYFLMKV